jgi:protein SCO1
MADPAPDASAPRPVRPRAVWTVAAIAVAAAAGIAAALIARQGDAPVLGAGTALDEPRALPDFSLLDARGEPFRRESLDGRWTLVFTGFTHCPDVCPMTIALFARLREEVPRSDLQLLFLSVDPERDTPRQVARYLEHFGPGIQGATGQRTEIERVTTSMGLAQVRNPGAGGDYTVDHSTALVLIDPGARVAGYFTAPHDPAALAADLKALPAA